VDLNAAMGAGRLLALLRARLWLVAMCVAVAAALAFVVSSAQPDRFRASAQVLFGDSSLAESVLGGAPSGSVAGGGQAARSLALASLDSVAARVKRRLPAAGSADGLKAAVSVDVPGQSDDLVSVSAEWGSASGAARVANAFADEIVAMRRAIAQGQVQRAIDAVNATLVGRRLAVDQARVLRDRLAQLELVKALQTGDATVVQRAVVPDSPSSPRPVRAAVLGGFVGGLLAVVLVLLGAVFDERIRGEEEVVAVIDAPVLARIPDLAGAGRRTPTWTAHQSPAFTEAFQFLRLNLPPRAGKKGASVLAVTSPIEGHGKTTVVAWLASALAASGTTVVAVDLDVRHPTLHAHFDIEDEPLAGMAHGDVVSTAQPRLALLPANGDDAIPSESLRADRVHDLFGRLRDRFDTVLVDTPPVTTVADASTITAAADVVVLVVDLKAIRRSELLATKEQLSNARANVVGVVLNRVTAAPAHHGPERLVANNGAGAGPARTVTAGGR
jgi:capsular exopolysaccharide synthesis family protein